MPTVQEILAHGTWANPEGRNYEHNSGVSETCFDHLDYAGAILPALWKRRGYHDSGTLLDARREMACRWVAQHFPFVELPPAAIRPVPRYEHSRTDDGLAQHFIQDAEQAGRANREDHNFRRFFADSDQEALVADAIAATIFDNLVAISDRHMGNWLVRRHPQPGQRHIILIDNAFTFYPENYIKSSGPYQHSGYYGPNMASGHAIPEDQREALRRIVDLDLAPLGQEYALDLARLTGFKQRAQALLDLKVL